ncbi:uncharacterized protein LOC116615690 [Nematostella vectensis]|uniref:uncharacterized protein LOC116615690 n=1 Tax=Nematostella vectensis TaxID=45351 RepID=UPI0013902EDF|nr:uncharacterized protein LOC116615690 [Nematostella vectensis]
MFGFIRQHPVITGLAVAGISAAVAYYFRKSLLSTFYGEEESGEDEGTEGDEEGGEASKTTPDTPVSASGPQMEAPPVVPVEAAAAPRPRRSGPQQDNFGGFRKGFLDGKRF